jgi:hypothetical protein
MCYQLLMQKEGTLSKSASLVITRTQDVYFADQCSFILAHNMKDDKWQKKVFFILLHCFLFNFHHLL